MSEQTGGEMLPVKALFSYDVLDAEMREFARQQASEIRQAAGDVTRKTVEVGKRLFAVKARFPKGYWSQWLNEEFAWSQSQANVLMRIAEVFGEIDLADVQMSATTLRLLTLASLPDEFIQNVKEVVVSKRTISTQEAREMVAQVDPELAKTYSNHTQIFRSREEALALNIANELMSATKNLQVALTAAYGDRLRAPVGKALDRLYALALALEDDEGRSAFTLKPQKGRKRKLATSSSRYWGVHWDTSHGKWRIHVRMPDGRSYTASFDTEEEAARGYDAVVYKVYGDVARLNFPNDPLGPLPSQRAKTSLFRGVEKKPSGRWGVRIGRQHLGTYDTEAAAARAYDAKARELYGDQARLNFPSDVQP